MNYAGRYSKKNYESGPLGLNQMEKSPLSVHSNQKIKLIEE